MEKGGLEAAFRAHGVTAQQRVVWADEMRVGLLGQVRRVWAPRGVKISQKVQLERQWAYLALAVDVRTGTLTWCWMENMKGESIAQALRQWQAEGIEAVVWDGARGHRAQVVQEAGVTRIQQPPYSPELNPVERVFLEIRRQVEGQVYDTLKAKKRTVEAVLEDLAAHPQKVKRLTCWSWIADAFQNLSQNMSLP